MDSEFPNVHEPQTMKHAIAVIEYAIANFRNDSTRIKKINKLKKSYLGKSNKEERDAIENIKGTSKSKVRYVDYRLTKSKTDRLIGEFIERPINGTVYAVNSISIKEKKDIVDFNTAYRAMQAPLQKLRENSISDTWRGMPPVDVDENGVMKDEVRLAKEIIMQRIINDFIKKKGLKDQLYYNRFDSILGSECFGKVFIDTDGFVKYRSIDIRNALFEETENDPYCLRSPYMGEYRRMYISEIVNEIPDFPSDKIKELKAIEGAMRENTYVLNSNTDNFVLDKKKNLLIDVFFVEYKAYDKWFISKTSKNKNGEYISSELSESYYNQNKAKVNRGINKEGWKIDIKEKEVKYKIARVGNDIYCGFEKCKNITGSLENPFQTEYDYSILLFGSVDGERVSIYQSMEDLKVQYNVVRMMINRELFKFKGMQLTYDRLMLPKTGNKTTTVDEVIIKMINDGIIDYSSGSDGGLYRSPNADRTGIDVKDLGFSRSMPMLLQMALDIEQTVDRLIGSNSERSGLIPASSTVTNSNQNLIASRSVTAPFDYFFDRYVENVLNKYVSRSKICYGILHRDIGENIVGIDYSAYFADNDISDDDYAFSIGDSRKEEVLRQIMRMYIPQSINARTLDADAAMAAEMADSLAEARLILQKNSDKLKDLQMQSQQSASEMESQKVQQALAMQKELGDMKARNDADLLILGSQLQRGEDAQKAREQFILNEQNNMAQMQMQEGQQV